MWKGSVGEELHHLEGERAIHTDPEETRRRRTILLIRKNNSWGFTLQVSVGPSCCHHGNLGAVMYLQQDRRMKVVLRGQSVWERFK